MPSDAEVRAAYTAGLILLARRELSEAQIRQRLRRKGHAADAVDEAVSRLKSERAIDDARVAEAIARTEVGLRRRGRMRVERQIQSAGIKADTARRAADAVYADVDGTALLAAALDRRLQGRPHIADRKEFQRLYRYLIAQGFEADQVLNILRAHSKSSPADD